MLLRCTQVASLCQIGVGFCLGKDLPFTGEVLLFAFKLSDALAKFCVVLEHFVVKRHFKRFLNLALNSGAVRPKY